MQVLQGARTHAVVIAGRYHVGHWKQNDMSDTLQIIAPLHWDSRINFFFFTKSMDLKVTVIGNYLMVRN